MVRNTYALLIAGADVRFVNTLQSFQSYLVDEAGFDAQKIRFVHSKKENINGYNEFILEETSGFFDNVKRDSPTSTVVIMYAGHGGKGKFFPSNSDLPSRGGPITIGEPVLYEEWGKLIDHEGNFIFINDSCYSGSSIKSFKRIGLLPKRGLVLASSRRKEKSYGKLFYQMLIDSYRKREVCRLEEIEVTPEYRSPVDISQYLDSKYPFSLVLEKGESNPETNLWEPIERTISIMGEYYEQKLNKESGQWEFVGKIPPTEVISPAITQHPQRCGLSLDHLLFPQ